MSSENAPKPPDPDMEGADAAILRAARRAREIARQTNTPIVIVRDGVLVEEWVTDAENAPPVTAVPPRT